MSSSPAQSTSGQRRHLDARQPEHARPPRDPRGSRTPDPARLAQLLVAAWMDVRDGMRPMGQIDALLSPALRLRLTAQVSPAARQRRGPTPRIRTVTSQQLRSDACEAVVLVTVGQRVTAVAVRLEIHAGSWRAVEMTAPESGLPAARTASSRQAIRARDAFDDLLEPEEIARMDQVLAAEHSGLRLRGSA
ncbi:MAG: Rv3235 family protein [Nitriliruptoraceae bacterium]